MSDYSEMLRRVPKQRWKCVASMPVKARYSYYYHDVPYQYQIQVQAGDVITGRKIPSGPGKNMIKVRNGLYVPRKGGLGGG